MLELKPVEYKVLSINEEKARAKVKFINPYKTNNVDAINIDHERDVTIPMAEGEADVDQFKTILEQLASAQSNKMLITLKNSSEVKKDAFKSILSLDKNIKIEEPGERVAEPAPDMIEPDVEPDVIEEEEEEKKPVQKLTPSKTTPPKKTARKTKTTSK